MIDERWVVLGALIALLGGLSYIVATVRGRTQPNRVTWLLWALAPMIAFTAEVREGVGLRSLMTFSAGFIPLLVLLASFLNRQSVWQLARLDYMCGALSLVGIALWQITGSGNVAITFAIVADFMAAVPTLLKSYQAPRTEHPLAFVTGGVNAAIALLTVQVWEFANWAFPAYIFGICVVLVILIGARVGPRVRGELVR
ncbi:MAG: hypothetical protein ACOYNI_12740 [Acidimicrobiia bacterium]